MSNNSFQKPENFKVSSRAPTKKEIRWLYKILSSEKYSSYRGKKVLEFGCGITSYAISQALDPKLYIAVENFQPCMDMCKIHIPGIQFVSTDWSDIPKNKYNVVMVDASSCPPKGLKLVNAVSRQGVPVEKHAPFRDDAINYILPYTKNTTIFICHDAFHNNPVWHMPCIFLENHGYECIDSFAFKKGIAVFRKS